MTARRSSPDDAGSVLKSRLYDWQYRLRQYLVGGAYRIVWRARSPGLGSKGPERVLLVFCGLIGDSILSTPLITEARRLWPRASLTLLGQKHNCKLLSSCPDLDETIETPGLPFSIRQRRQIRELRRRIRAGRFDVAIIALGDQFAQVLAQANIPIRVGVRGTPLEPCLTHSYDIGSARTWGPKERLNALSVLGLNVSARAEPRLWVDAAARRRSGERLQELGINAQSGFAIVHPFGSTLRQWWPLNNLGPLAAGLLAQRGLQTLVIGGPETSRAIHTVEGGGWINATGRLELDELLAVIERAALVITTDSGPFHMAGALGRPVLGLFRASRPEHATRYPHARVLFGRNPSCDHRCSWDSCRTTPCAQIQTIAVDQVLAAVDGEFQAGNGVLPPP